MKRLWESLIFNGTGGLKLVTMTYSDNGNGVNTVL